ncbi:dTDP-4-dehydrorhamnose 3,5-epimerase [Kordiimonas marina]|uniref:dTDP-4-dehydrorhamnose 3,5-epimerase n=1 Tax=Kordiimonas marina TaxID=2872312 RepID=UPI001FF5F9C5|nr:dTDP-4-dehydrorhamnose 3,5-epimerase [Kordiimonas marina]MCJ9429765.1 dTDP-4-dehydrorhamnose 3,5-epimerase [Kordiimonas marina]
MEVEETAIPGVFILTPKRFGDDRGFFSETFNQKTFDAAIPGQTFVQDNHSLSRDPGVVRGLHYQKPPFAQGKLVRVISGAVLDAAVDIRKGSPTYGQHVAVELTAENWKQLWVPAGFAHAFCTLVPDTAFFYKVTNYYSPEHDAGLAFDDPDIGIDWPFTAETATLSAKDKALPAWADFDSPFVYGENC